MRQPWCSPLIHVIPISALVRCKPWGQPHNRAWEQTLNIWPTLLEFGVINVPLLFITSCRWCSSSAEVTKWLTIRKSHLFFIPKILLIIPYPYNYSVSYPLSLKLFCQLSHIPKTPNRASKMSVDQQLFPALYTIYAVENVLKYIWLQK